MNNTELTVYTDGGCRNHGNKKNQHVKTTDPAAWAYLVKGLPITYQETNGRYGATNNQMELTAIIEALTWLKVHNYQQKSIELISDSKYFLDAITKHWLTNWITHNWHTKQGKPVANTSEWKAITKLLPSFDQIEFQWTKGHAANDGNNYVDHLLNTTMDKMEKSI